MPVPERVEMDIVDVPREIVLVARRMLPITALLSHPLSLAGTASRNRSVAANLLENELLIKRRRVGKSASPSCKVKSRAGGQAK
jgi:hypothetical protein